MRRHASLVAVIVGLAGLTACGGGDAGVRAKDGSGLSASGDSSPTSAVAAATTVNAVTTDAAATTVITPDSSASTTTQVIVETTSVGLPADDVYPLQEGSAGPEVERLQRALERAGYDVGISRVDGGFGPDTASGVRMFQRVTGRALTGVADRALLAAIEAAPAAPMFVLTRDSLGAVRLGDDPETVIAYLTARLGPPESDDGWSAAIGPCNLTETRTVSWPSLAATFGDYSVATASAGPRQLILLATGYNPPTVPDPRPRTEAGLRAGDTIARLLRLYPDAEVFPDDGVFGPSFNVHDKFYGSVATGSPDRVGSILVGQVPCGE